MTDRLIKCSSEKRIAQASPAPMTVAECLEAVLFEHGIELAVTIPGGPLMPLLKAIHQRRRIRTVIARHESGAAMLAEGYWRVGRRPALLAVTAGPGVSNAATGIALAHAEHTPVLVISAQVSNNWYGRGAAQELDTVRLLGPITKCSMALRHPERTQQTLEWLMRVATTGRGGPVHLSVPADLWARSALYRSRGAVAVQSPRSLSSLRIGAEDDTLSSAIANVCARLGHAQRPSFLVGSGALAAGAANELVALAERFPRLTIACTPRAKGAFPECHPQSLGVFGFAGHPAAEKTLLESSDLLIVIGSRLGEITSLTWDARFCDIPLIQIDIEPSELGKNFPIELGIAADARFVLRQLLAGCDGSTFPVARSTGGSPRATEPLAATAELPECSDPCVHPARLMSLLSAELDGDTHVFVDIGNTMAWALHYLRRDKPGYWHINLMFGCMGHSLPAAVGGGLAINKPVVALIGDAAFAMCGFELHTAVEYDIPLVVIVLNDRGHGMVIKGSEHQYGPDQVPDARFKHAIDARTMAESVGARAVSVSSESAFVAALHGALTSRKQAVIDVHIDREAVPPFGSRMEGLAKNFAESREAQS